MPKNRKIDFDISVSGAKKKKKTGEPSGRTCEWPDCEEDGKFPAPKSPDNLREYRHFCMEHVRAYNRSWNFFKDMADEDVQDYIRNNSTWQRPTWSMNTKSRKGSRETDELADPFELFDDGPSGPSKNHSRNEAPRRPKLTPMTEEALVVLDLDYPVTLQQVKRRYKELVKRFHPDSNGGDRSAEDQLKKTIWAYNHLKASRVVRA